ncbi:hypothetical protein [Spirosoma endophyticum]|nr:hypothetical protein [Spirosoma endophyticum]
MSLAEFWNMPPHAFQLKVEGFFERENRTGLYFRETYALLYNINRGEKTQPIDGKDVILLAGEKKSREPRHKKGTFASMTPEQLQAWTDRVNQQEKKEREAVAAAVQQLMEVGIDQVPTQKAGESNPDYANRLIHLKESTPVAWPQVLIETIKAAGLTVPACNPGESWAAYDERLKQYYESLKPITPNE